PLALSPGFFADGMLAQVSGNTFSCGLAQGFTLNGTLATNSTLRVIEGKPDLRLTNTLTVSAGVRLTIPPGRVLNAQGTAIAVNGTLLAQGTMGQPITFNNLSLSLGLGSDASQISNDVFNGTGACACLSGRCCAFPAVLITDASPLVQGNTFNAVDMGIAVT